MDVYVTREALSALRALSFLPRAELEGFLLGHERGHRRIVEKVLPTVKGFFPSLETFTASDRALHGGVIGFFSFKPSRERLKKLLSPFACEKVFLDASGLVEGKGGLLAFLIDFERKFGLRPAACILEKEKRDE